MHTLKELLNYVQNLEGVRLPNGHKVTKDFVFMSVSIETKRGKTVKYYSVSDKCVSGMYEQAHGIVTRLFDSKKHTLKIVMEP